MRRGEGITLFTKGFVIEHQQLGRKSSWHQWSRTPWTLDPQRSALCLKSNWPPNSKQQRSAFSSLITMYHSKCAIQWWVTKDSLQGTLTPIVSLPTDAVPSMALLDALQKLSSDPMNNVFIVSGRDATFLDTHFARFNQIGLGGEHGCLLKLPSSGERKWRDMTKEGGFDLSWKKDVLAIFQYYTERTIGSMIEEKQASVTWHYRQADPHYGYVFFRA